MPIKSLEPYLFERGQANSYPLEILRNARLGIDVNHYISRLIGFKKESFLDAIGGFPQSFKHSIEVDLQVFREYNITPIFVFSGNNIADQYAFKNSKDQKPLDKVRNTSWSKYQTLTQQQQQIQRSVLPPSANPLESFRDYFSPFSPDSIIPELIDYLYANDLEYIRAPYFSWVQLSYLYEEDHIDAIYGPTETILLANVDKFILGMEFTSKEFRYVDRIKVLNDFQISQTQLLDIAVSVGCDLQPVTLPIYTGFPPTAIFDVGLEIVSTGGSIYGSVLSLNNEAVTEKFQKGVLALQYTPVLKINGRVELQRFDEQNPGLPEHQPPTDVHDIIGQRLPHEYYFYESIGLIQPKVLESIVFGTYVEKFPLDGIITAQFRSTVNKIPEAFKDKEINLLTQNMARYYQVKRIHYIKPFESGDVELENRMNPPLYNGLSPLVVRSETEDFDLLTFLKSLPNDDIIGKSAARLTVEADKLQKNYEILSTSMLRLLYLLGFFDFKDSKIVHNKWTKALLMLSELDTSFELEQYLLLLLFLKLNPFDLTADLSAVLVGGSKTTNKEQREIILLVARLATFVQVEQKKQNYSGALSRSLLNFRSSIDLIRENTRELFESILVNSLSNNEATKIERSSKSWKSLVSQIPYKRSFPNTILAIVVQSYLDYHYSGNSLKVSKDIVLSYFDNPASGLSDLSSDFKRAFRFVRESFKLVGGLHEAALVNEKVYQAFVTANKLAEDVLKL